MLRHYYTLLKIVEELQCLKGFEVAECFTQDKNSLVIAFYDGRETRFLQFSADPKSCGLFLRPKFARAKKNTAAVLPSLAGETLQQIKLMPGNRIAVFQFINTDAYALLYGGSKSNMTVVNSAGIIIDALKFSIELKGSPFLMPKSNLKPLRAFPDDTGIAAAAAKCSVQLGKYYAAELFGKLNLDPDRPLSSFSKTELTSFETEISRFRDLCLSSNKFYILMNDKKESLLSLTPLRAYPEITAEFTSANEAALRKTVGTIKDGRYKELYNSTFKKLEREEKKLRRNIALAKDDTQTTERTARYRFWAELLAAQPNPGTKAGAAIKLEAWDGTKAEIPLDGKMTLMENSGKYFKKARAAAEEAKITKKRLPGLELRLRKIENDIEKFVAAKTIRELENMKKNLEIIPGKRMETGERDISGKFRAFDLGGGYTLYVGKSAANNDELTMRFARPNDLWFHARGAGGSHAVLRIEKGEKPPKSVVRKAAAVAAYYSQARKAKYTPVAYTFKKYIRKPKGASPGSVVMAREEVVMVEPRLPEDTM